VETETVPPELAARFAEAERHPAYRAAMRPRPSALAWVNLALLILIVGGVTAGIWVVALTAQDFAQDRGKGASVAGVVTAVMAFGGWVGVREWRARATGKPRSVLAVVAGKEEDNDLSIGSATRYRICKATFVTRAGDVEDRKVDPALYDELIVGEIGIVFLRDDRVVEWNGLVAPKGAAGAAG
jgi:hypothetical protein